MKQFSLCSLAALVQLFLWAHGLAQPLQKIRIGYPSISSRQAQLWVAKDEGIFRKYGLDVELIFLRGGQVAIQALTGGIYLIFANKQPTLNSLAKYMRTNEPDVLDYSYQHYLKRTPKKPYPTMKGIQNLIDMSVGQIPQAKTAKPEQFVDLSLLQELEAEKFFDEMAKRYW